MSLGTVLAVAACLGFSGFCLRRFAEMQEVARVRADVQRRLVDLGWIQ